MATKYFCCYYDYRQKLAKLTDEQVGKVFRAAMLYAETGEISDLPFAESLVFDFIRYDIDQTKKEYERRCETNRANANRRKPSQATATDGNQAEATEANKNTNEKTNKKTNVVYDDKEKSPSAAVTEQEETIFGRYNELCPSLNPARNLTNKRREAIRELLTHYATDDITEGFRRAQNTPFLCGGGTKGWKADFDWLIAEEHFTRLLEGGYDEHQKNAAYSPDKYNDGGDFLSGIREEEYNEWT